MRACILQPSYIPWRSYFHQIHEVDVFVFYDDVDYDPRGWRNRNKVKTQGGVKWLTIPVRKRPRGTPILEIEIDDSTDWARKHWDTLHHAYGRAPHWDRYAALLEPHYRSKPERLADFTIALTEVVSRELGLETRFLRSSTLAAEGRQTERLLSILAALGADHYVTGPSAREYLEEERFAAAGIGLEYMTYDYPEYPQLHPPYELHVSILDTLFMLGPEASAAIW